MISTAHEQPPHLSTQNTQDAALIFLFSFTRGGGVVADGPTRLYWGTGRGSDCGYRSVQTKLKVYAAERAVRMLDRKLQGCLHGAVPSDLTRTSVFDVQWEDIFFNL